MNAWDRFHELAPFDPFRELDRLAQHGSADAAMRLVSRPFDAFWREHQMTTPPDRPGVHPHSFGWVDHKDVFPIAPARPHPLSKATSPS